MTGAREWLWWLWCGFLHHVVCRAIGHRKDEWGDVIGCCVRCYHTVPQTPENRAILQAALAAYDEQHPEGTR